MASIAQIRAARALLGWSQTELAEAAGLSRPSVDRAERTGVSPETIAAIVRALEAAGIAFVTGNGGGEGVRFKRTRRN